jgi:hypothetical protein
MTETGNPIRSWLRGLGIVEWGADERPYAALLDALTRDRVAAEIVEAERNATSRRDPAGLREDQTEMAREELDEAQQELGTFRTALEDLRARGGEGGEVPYDAADPVQDAHADALIQFVVRAGYGEVRTEEPSPGRYVYWIRADWSRLRALAEAAGHPLPA